MEIGLQTPTMNKIQVKLVALKLLMVIKRERRRWKVLMVVKRERCVIFYHFFHGVYLNAANDKKAVNEKNVYKLFS